MWQSAGGADRLSPGDAAGLLNRSEWVVPGALSGPEAGLTRVAAMVVIAAGSLIVALVGLGVAQALAAAQ